MRMIPRYIVLATNTDRHDTSYCIAIDILYTATCMWLQLVYM